MKKHSATNSLPEFVFFIDRSLGKRVIAEALRRAGATVEIHDDHFAHEAKDEAWLSKVGERGWIVLTKDSRIGYRHLETSALISAKVRTFVLTSKNLTGPDMANAFAAALPKMKRLAGCYEGPFIAKVYRNGSVLMWRVFERGKRE